MARLAAPVAVPLGDTAKLQDILKKGTHKSCTITRARALLVMGSGNGTAAVQAEAGISTSQYYRLKARYLAGGLAQALEERPRSGQPPKVTAALEAQITSLACSELPVGVSRWTLSLLNQTLVSLDDSPAVSNETIRQVLKKANASPG